MQQRRIEGCRLTLRSGVRPADRHLAASAGRRAAIGPIARTSMAKAPFAPIGRGYCARRTSAGGFQPRTGRPAWQRSAAPARVGWTAADVDDNERTAAATTAPAPTRKARAAIAADQPATIALPSMGRAGFG